MSKSLKVGSTFDVPIEIVDIDSYSSKKYILEWANPEVESILGELNSEVTREEIAIMSDPNYKERLKQQRIKELEKELKQLKGEDVE